MKLVMAGASIASVCGIRDCAHVLRPALADVGCDVTLEWWERRREDGAAQTVRDARAFAERIAAQARDADAVLWHYSPFSYGPRGLPIATPIVARRLRTVPLVLFLHELAYPWRATARGVVHAASQRAALWPLLRTADGVVVATEERASWVRRKSRLPLAVVPVPSNVPVEPAGTPQQNGVLHVGVVGFGTDGAAADVVARALAELSRRGVQTQLQLIGAPGAAGGAAARWRTAAVAAGYDGSVHCSGVLPPAELSRVLGATDAIVFPDPVGPTARRGTLAAALAHGRAIVALDGAQTWRQAVDERALVVAPPDGVSVARALETLAHDTAARDEQGQRARAFYERVMSADAGARRIVELVEQVTR